MELTQEQKEKALAILGEELPYRQYEQLKLADDTLKEKALDCHFWALRLLEEVNLPYRLLYDYLMQYGTEYLRKSKYQYGVLPTNNHDCATDGKIVLISRLYPRPGYEIKKLKGIKLSKNAELVKGPFLDDVNSTKWHTKLVLHGSLAVEVKSKAAEQFLWNLDTSEGISRWEYYFAHFLNTAELEEYNTFDYFGRRESLKGDIDKINHWKWLRADYQLCPDKYLQQEPKMKKSDRFKFTLWQTYFIQDSNEKT